MKFRYFARINSNKLLQKSQLKSKEKLLPGFLFDVRIVLNNPLYN
jgi:hypothetical protein